MYNKNSNETVASFLPTNSKVDVEALKSLPTWFLASLGVGGLGAALAATKPRARVDPKDKQHQNDVVTLQKYSASQGSWVNAQSDYAKTADWLDSIADAASQAQDYLGIDSNAIKNLGTLAANAGPKRLDSINSLASNLKSTLESAVESGQEAISNAGKSVVDGVVGANDNRSAFQRPWFLPALAATTAGGVGLGNLAGRKLFGSIREDAREQEKEDARKEYEEALAAFSKSSKEASENKLANALNRLYAHMSKTSEDATAAPITANLGALAGAYLALTGGLGAYGAYQGFKNQRKTDEMRAIEHAARLEQLEDQDRLNPGRVIFA